MVRPLQPGDPNYEAAKAYHAKRGALMGQQPYTFSEARDALKSAATAQAASEEFLRETYKMFAQAEEAYRVALATRIVELRAEGAAATLCADLARGEKDVAELRRKRDIAEGVKEAAGQAAWRRAANRKDAQRLADWSMRIDLRDDQPQPDWSKTSVIGGRTS